MNEQHIIISRCKEYGSSGSPFRVYIDEVYAGSLAIGETQVFSVPAGKHTVQVEQSLSLYRSKKYRISESKTSPCVLEASTSLLGTAINYSLLLFLLLVGLISFLDWRQEAFHTLDMNYVLSAPLAYFALGGKFIRLRPL